MEPVFLCINSYACMPPCTHTHTQEPQERTFGQPYYVDQFSGSKRRKVIHSDKFYYVPLIDSIRNLLTLEDFQAEVLHPHNLNDQLGDFCDGSIFKEHPIFSTDPHALQVVAYYDELEVVNPIGSFVKRHKLGCVFFFLANVRPQLRSTLKSIQLIAVAKHQDVQQYGIDDLLSPFVEELKTLYCDGINVSIAGQERVLHGALLAFLADTLAAHSVGGFKESMGFALRICRTCMITRPLSQSCFSETDSECVLRTPATHFEQCSLLQGELCHHYSTSYGVNRLSVLEEVPSFSVTSGLPHDIMHDLFEGVVPNEMKQLLSHCIQEKYFTLRELNDRILSFDFPKDSKPVPIDVDLLKKPGNKLRQSASQMMTLCQMLPLIIADKIPEDDENWHSFLVLLKICSIAVTPVCTYDTISYLKVLIEENLTLFRKLYPSHNLIPKQHYMVHYPAQIGKFGPLIHCWTMRQESKLRFLKIASRCSNYKNICKSVSKKHQFWLCYKIQSEKHLLLPSLEMSPAQTSSILENEADYVITEVKRLFPDLSSDALVQHPNWVKIQSSHFREGAFVMLRYDEFSPLFGKIIDVITIDSRVILSVQEYYGKVFVSHFNAFVIKSRGVVSAICVDSLPDHRTFSVKNTFIPSDNVQYITMPYYY